MKSAVNLIIVLYFIYATPHMDARFLGARWEFEWSGGTEEMVYNCSSKQQCPSGYCCTGLIMVSEDEDLGVCRKYKAIGEQCVDKIYPGDMICPCARGLTCTRDTFSEVEVHTCETVAIHQGPWGMFKEQM
ncbi:uncharacterized protein LOC114521868 [Dendronephthya gigantea]|uniref:uncharacterized protein LOC114521868 n=1 Tax=Dendronephthya gigantea TaxID=151771 RepID=UPI00106D1B78|nr:uncharacterized protein LOC114521868 [Dendronephthya gigantea]